MLSNFRKAPLAGLLALCSPAFAAGPYVNAQLPYHVAKLDAQSKLQAWYEPDRNLGWDHVLHLGWDFLEHKVPLDQRYGTGLKVSLLNSVFNGETLQADYWQHNPAMTFAGLVDGVVAWYPYSGDTASIAVVREMLDHQLSHGTSPADWDWAGVPFATSCGNSKDYGSCIQNMPKEFYGGIETDKVGELGAGYALFYQLTADRKYLDAALRCATALAKHVRPGDAEHTPWPFRVDARTGVTLAREEFGGNIVGPLRLFDELIRLQQDKTGAFAQARATAVQWLLSHPLNRESAAWNKWTGYFEDVSQSVENVNQVLPTMVAWYVLSNPDPASVTPKWTRWPMMTGRLIDWVRTRFGRGPYSGAWAIDEQGTPDGHGCCSRAGLGSHTSRWAALNALYYEKTGDLQAREDAFRALNYASYFALSDGRVSCCGEGFGSPFWFSDGYSDYLRHFNWAMASMPEFAPIGEDHLLRSSSVVQSVAYSKGAVSYRTFAESSTEVLRLSYKPGHIGAGGQELKNAGVLSANSYTLTAVQNGDYVVSVRHESARDVQIQASALVNAGAR